MALLRQPAYSAGLCVRVGDAWIKGSARTVHRFANRQPARAEDRPQPPVIPADATNIWTEFRDIGAWLERPANKVAREIRLIAFMLTTRRLMLDERGEVQGIFIVPTHHFGTLANASDINELRYQWETGRPDDKGVLVYNRGTGQIPCADRLEGADCEIYFIWMTERLPTFDQRRDRISFTVDDLQALLDALQRIPDRWTCDHLEFRVGPTAGRLSDDR